tara:strand:+ start:1299 stop:1640 length:342 start_codon:yes stop_codon:yes gene_type:complete
MSQRHTINITYHNDDGVEAEGEFLFTLPSLRARIAIGVEEARLREGITADLLDDVTLAVIVQFSYLKNTVQFPVDLTFDDNVDPYLMSKLYEEALSFESTFLNGRDRSGNNKE